jgi:hypothetical protein
MSFNARKSAYTCNSSYSGGRDQEDCALRPAWAKKFMRPPISINKLGVMVYVCNQALWEAIACHRLSSKVGPGKNMRPYLKNR